MPSHCLLLLSLFTAASLQDPSPAPPPPVVVGIGATAPRLCLNDHDGRATTVGGATTQWTVLAFFPKAATPG